MDREEFLIRRLHGNHLLTLADAACVPRDLCGLQAQFLRNAVHALRIRADAARTDGLIKTWTLRGTVHLIPESDLPLYLPCGTADDVCESGWYRWQAGRGNANPPEVERHYAHLAVEAIAAGNDTRDGLRDHLRSCGMTEEQEARLFDPWGGLIGELATMGVIAFRVDMADGIRPVEEKRYRLLPPFTPLPQDQARRELLRRYLTHYGPATLRDAAYFFHWTQAEVKAVLRDLPVQTCPFEGRTAYFIPGDEPMTGMPPVRLLAGFDPLMLGYRKEDNPFLPPEHLRGVFNLAGIVHPAILLHGRVVGRWKERAGKAELTAFEPIAPADRQRIEAETARLYPIKKMIWT